MVTKDIASLDFIFYESYAPFNKKKKEHSMAISKGNRAMLVNDGVSHQHGSLSNLQKSTSNKKLDLDVKKRQ